MGKRSQECSHPAKSQRTQPGNIKKTGEHQSNAIVGRRVQHSNAGKCNGIQKKKNSHAILPGMAGCIDRTCNGMKQDDDWQSAGNKKPAIVPGQAKDIFLADIKNFYVGQSSFTL